MATVSLTGSWMVRNALVIAGICSAFAVPASGVTWVPLYQTDFSSDPGWVSNNPEHFHWDSASQAYYSRQIDQSEEYAYHVVAGFNATRPWRLEWDIKKVASAGAADARFGVWDALTHVEIPAQSAWVDAYHFFQAVYRSDAGGFGDDLTGAISLDVWYRVRLEWVPAAGGTATASVWRKADGQLLGTVSRSGVGVFGGVDRIGMSTVGDPFSGDGISLIDNVALFQPCAPAPDGIVGWWPGDESTVDFVGGNHGTLQNGATYGAGFIGSAFDLNQPNAHISLGDPVALQFAGDFSVVMWVKFAGPLGPRGTHLYSQRAPGCGEASGQIQLERDTQNLEFAPGIGPSRVSSGLPVPTGEWTFIAVVYHAQGASSTVDFYVNGAQSIGLATGPLGSPLGADVEIGQANGCGPEDAFTGLIDEVQLYGRALTAGEIHTEYAAGRVGKCKLDCNANQRLDRIDIATGGSSDCNTDEIPDECELSGNDCNHNLIPDECEPDCDGDHLIDDCDPDDDDDGVLDGADVCPCSAGCSGVDAAGRPVGDVNGDCAVNGVDVQALVNALLCQQGP